MKCIEKKINFHSDGNFLTPACIKIIILLELAYLFIDSKIEGSNIFMFFSSLLKKYKNMIQVQNQMCAIYGESTVDDWMCSKVASCVRFFTKQCFTVE